MNELSLSQEYSYSGLQGLFVVGSVGGTHQQVVGHFREHQTDIDPAEGGGLEGVHNRLSGNEVRSLKVDVLLGVLESPFVTQLEDRQWKVRLVRDDLDQFVPERLVGCPEVYFLFG